MKGNFMFFHISADDDYVDGDCGDHKLRLILKENQRYCHPYHHPTSDWDHHLDKYQSIACN
ncbi:hypothetical protein DERP_000577 [Dermatophagoides pteronyssinus]|uniref:Uncharacterized protein n=1 Tax=Dermatophagoides pteronyssinus TaxID=6956 RepID=A0ABQ8J0Q8_DERPT|nr:hypothetical protein DERP_000577 [Dermatophagoides pteronyssinus]